MAWHDIAMALNEVARTMLKELDLQDPPYPTISKLSHCPNRVKLGGWTWYDLASAKNRFY